MWKKKAKTITTVACGALLAAGSLMSVQAQEAQEAISSVYSIGFVDADGSKLKAIAVEYDTEIPSDAVSEADYEIEDYGILEDAQCELGENPGAITRVYVNDEAATSEEGAKSGKYVIIEVNTDYQLAAVPTSYQASMAAGVKQTQTITAADGTEIPATEDFIRNYTVTQQESENGTVNTYEVSPEDYVITDIDQYELHTIEDGTAFHATDCFDEATGESSDIDLPYALYVPEDYSEDGNYALVLHVHDAGFMGTDPMITLTESNAPAYFASEEAAQLVKAQGLDGIIVVAPQFEDAIRTTRDNYTTSAGVPATWQLLDSLTETYSIDEDHIYGSGQSMGAMQVIDMAAQRDNYFAGIWACGSQWGNNYNKEASYRGAQYYKSEDPTIWTTDADGNDSDYGQNWYYLISDDNILSTSCIGDTFSSTIWTELVYLYQDIAGVEIPYTAVDPLNDSVEDQNAALEALLAQDNQTGIYRQAFDGGSHMLTWVYGRKLTAGYEWLLSQNRQDEMNRDKIEALNRPWAAETDEAKIAEKQTDDRVYSEVDGVKYYYAVPAEGAGTIGYNTSWFNPMGAFDALPGWSVSEE